MDKSLYLLSIRANTHPSQGELAVGELAAEKNPLRMGERMEGHWNTLGWRMEINWWKNWYCLKCIRRRMFYIFYVPTRANRLSCFPRMSERYTQIGSKGALLVMVLVVSFWEMTVPTEATAGKSQTTLVSLSTLLIGVADVLMVIFWYVNYDSHVNYVNYDSHTKAGRDI